MSAPIRFHSNLQSSHGKVIDRLAYSFLRSPHTSKRTLPQRRGRFPLRLLRNKAQFIVLEPLEDVVRDGQQPGNSLILGLI